MSQHFREAHVKFHDKIICSFRKVLLMAFSYELECSWVVILKIKCLLDLMAWLSSIRRNNMIISLLECCWCRQNSIQTGHCTDWGFISFSPFLLLVSRNYTSGRFYKLFLTNRWVSEYLKQKDKCFWKSRNICKADFYKDVTKHFVAMIHTLLLL